MSLALENKNMGLTEIIDFSTFIGLIKKEKRSSLPSPIENIQFSTLEKNLDPRFNEGQDHQRYKTVTTPMIPGNLETIALVSLYHQGKTKTLDKNDERLKGLIVSTALIYSHSFEFGKTTHIVELGDGRYLPANPSDFEIHTTGSIHALCCLAACRTIIYKTTGF